MKVLWFANTSCNAVGYFREPVTGGGWLQALDLELQDKIDLYVAYYEPRNIPPFKFLSTSYYPISSRSIRVNAIKSIFGVYYLDKDDLEEYLKIIDSVKPDVIHIHGTENAFNCIIEHTSIPVVVSIQGNIQVIHHKFSIGIRERYLKKRKKPNWRSIHSSLFNRSFLYQKKRFEKMAEREAQYLRHTKYVIGRTYWDKCISTIMSPKAEYFHCDEMLREAFYGPAWRKKSNDERLIIHTTSGDAAFKGFETLCAAVFELNQYGLSFEWRVAGIGEQDLIVRVVKAQLGMRYPRTSLVLMGKLTEDDLVGKLLEADIYVMPSHIENSPNNLCEAMLLGLPCIATFAGGTGSLLQNGIDGVLIQDGDPWVMAGAIVHMMANPDEACLMGQRARQNAIKRHDKRKVVDELISIYTHILS